MTARSLNVYLFLRKAAAFLKRDLLEALSYKSAFVFEFFAAFASILPFFFIGKLIDSGRFDYFPFVLIGIAFSGYQSTALNSFMAAVNKEQDTGTLEAMMMTPTGLSTVILAGSLWEFLFASLRIAFYLLIGAVFLGVDLSRMNGPAALAAVLLTLSALAGLGIFSAGFMLVYKRGNPVSVFLNSASKLLAGVYFPLSVFPDWIQAISYGIPLTYALEALRGAILTGKGIPDLQGPLLALAGFTVVLLPLGISFFNWAVKKAKRDASLIHL